MKTQPPFDPPYITAHSTAHGIQWIETLADGTTRPVQLIETDERRRQVMSRKKATHHPKPLQMPYATASGPERKTESHANLIPGGRQVMMFLDVPFEQKDTAKNLGAKWDSAMRKWYVPHGVDIHLFTRWWPATLEQEMKGFGQL